MRAAYRSHVKAAILVRLDLESFFPSIGFERVRGDFAHLGLNPGIATALALICTDAPRVKLTLDGIVRYVARGRLAYVGRVMPEYAAGLRQRCSSFQRAASATNCVSRSAWRVTKVAMPCTKARSASPS